MKINGLKVVDPRTPVTIHITARDVTRGNKKDPGGCAAALACLRDTPCTQARVHIGRTYLKIGNEWQRYMTPRQLRTEIISFDRGAMFQPGNFKLAPVPPSARLGKKGAGSDTSRSKPKRLKVARKYRVIEGVRQHGANR